MSAAASRRHVLAALGLGGAAVALAGCTAASDRAAPAGPSDGSPGSSRASSSSAQSSAPPSSGPSGSSVAKPTYDDLSRQLTRPLIGRSSSAYAAAARLYSPRFDGSSRPAAIARCTSAQDVAHCIRFAAEAGVPFALRAGGHSYGGWSTSAGLVVDTSAMSAVRVARTSRTARIGAGARLVDVYTAVGRAGLALGAGSCPTVGLTGLALGGGVGVLSRAFGLTCDAVQAATVVTADGRTRTVDATHDADLFWALRGGGGGSFAAVVDLTLRLRPAPTVQTFFLSFGLDRGAQVLAAWQRWIARADRSLWSTCKLLSQPDRGTSAVTVSGTWLGAASGLTGQLAPLLAATGAPDSRTATSLDYVSAMLAEAGCSGQDAASCTSSALAPAQRLPFAATSSFVTKPLSGSGLDAVVAQARRAGSVPGLHEGGVSFDSLGGAVADVRAQDTAFAYRSALASVQYTATWTDASTPATAFDNYVRGFRSALRPWLGTGAYVNYADASIANFGDAYWAGNYRRLQQIKKTYDPHSLFTFAQAVRPA